MSGPQSQSQSFEKRGGVNQVEAHLIPDPLSGIGILSCYGPAACGGTCVCPSQFDRERLGYHCVIC